MRIIIVAFHILLLAACVGVYLYYNPSSCSVVAVAETDPVRHDGDAADDAAIWIHPSDPSLSVIIGTDKDGGLGVYDLTGKELQFIDRYEHNNVDVRESFRLDGRLITLVAASANHDNRIMFYEIDPESRTLSEILGSRIDLDLDPSGLCLYRSSKTGKFYVFVNGDRSDDSENWMEQFELFESESGRIGSSLVRAFKVGGEVEGCVADDELGDLFMSEENTGIWKCPAEPDVGEERSLVDCFGVRGNLRYNAEGLTLYLPEDGKGYLLASSQGSNDFTVYERSPDNAYVGRFKIVAGNGIDEVTHSDGIDVTSRPLGDRFPQGLFVAQDNDNDGSNQNFKLVSWKEIAGVMFDG